MRALSNELQTLLARVDSLDAATGQDLRRVVEALASRREYGLNFERHLPEQVALVDRPIGVGDKVRFIPPRGETTVESKATWVVTKISGRKGKRVASLLDPQTKTTTERVIEDLVYVADFRDPIYPGLKSTGKVERAATSRSMPSSTPRTITRSKHSFTPTRARSMPSTFVPRQGVGRVSVV
jgi:adenine-specific DNA-methyltransferase